MKKGIIDLGTNTFNLLIGEVNDGVLQCHRSEKEAVLLGMNGINHGKIAEEAWLRAIQTLMRFKKYCEEDNVTEIIGFGTSALRDAKNGDLFIKEVKEQTGIPIEIITGERETQLIYQGVKLIHDFIDPGVIMDIGGGSTEFIFASNQGVQSAASFDIGVSRLYQDFDKNNNFTERQYKFMNGYLEARTADFFQGKEIDLLIGASGSFETFYEMIYQRRFTTTDKTVRLPMHLLIEKLEWVLASRYEDRVNHEWIVPMRKKMLPITAYKIKWVIEKLQVKDVILSPYSLKEGAFLD